MHGHADVDAACRELVRGSGEAGWLARTRSPDAARDTIDVRTLCLAREILARHAGLPISRSPCRGSAPASIALFGQPALRARMLPGVRAGDASGGVRAVRDRMRAPTSRRWRCAAARVPAAGGSTARRPGFPMAASPAHYVVFARTGEAPGARGLSAFVVEAGQAGPADRRADRGDRAASAGDVALRELCACRDEPLLGAPGEGFKVAMATLDIFRPTVGAAALGFARRALRRGVRPRAIAQDVRRRRWRDLQMTQAKLADMALEIDAARCWSIAPRGRRDVQRTARSPARRRWRSCTRPRRRST